MWLAIIFKNGVKFVGKLGYVDLNNQLLSVPSLEFTYLLQHLRIYLWAGLQTGHKIAFFFVDTHQIELAGKVVRVIKHLLDIKQLIEQVVRILLSNAIALGIDALLNQGEIWSFPPPFKQKVGYFRKRLL